MAGPPPGPSFTQMNSPPPFAHDNPRVIIAGGGVAAVETLLALRELAEDRIEIELLAPDPHFVYRPMVVAEAFGIGEEHRFDLSRVCDDQGAALRVDGLSCVDAERHVVQTTTGVEVEYDALVVARGARAREAVPGAVTFSGRRDIEAIRTVLDTAASPAGEVRRLVFAGPGGLTWMLPLYELAMLSRAHLDERGREDIEIAVTTSEESPLGAFGPLAGDTVRELLEDRRIELITGHYPTSFREGVLHLVPDMTVDADLVVALPWLEGPWIDGLPADDHGFLPIDAHGAVRGVDDVYAAGDATDFPIKQGGLASQQADALAEMIAARAGVPVEARPFVPVLRGVLLTGDTPTYLRSEITGGRGVSSISNSPLWWPPSKIAGRHLSPYLALRPGLRETPSAV
jgi:sulfide:quinone oxidoreductase